MRRRETNRSGRLAPLLGLPLVLGVLLTAASAPEAQATVGPDPYAASTITKVYDGTGHDTPDGPFINKANGYNPGDNTRTDGVVTSNDFVGYEVETRFVAGPERTVDVRFDVPEFLEFETEQNPGACTSNQFATGSAILSSDGELLLGCSYKVKRGVGVTVQSEITATALDTAGNIERDQVMSVETGMKGENAYSSDSAAAVMVLSAPAADLVLRPSTCSVYGSCGAHTYSNQTGSLFVMVKPLKWDGYNTVKGASTAGQWTAQLDVSEFPAGTEWTVDGVPVGTGGSVLNLGPYEGSKEVKFTVPDLKWGDTELQEGESRYFDAHLIVPDTAFETASYKNNGTGWEPGQGEPANVSTLDARGTGALKGYVYPNNDWTRLEVYRKAEPRGMFGKIQYRPWNAMETRWEDGNRVFAEKNSTANTRNSSSFYWGIVRTGEEFAERDVAPGTQLLSQVYANTTRPDAGEGPNLTQVILSDTWDTNFVVADPSREAFVTGPDGTAPTSSYTIQWSTTVGGENTLTYPGQGWITSKTPIDGAKSARVIFDSLPRGSADGAGIYSLYVPTKVKEDLTEPDIPTVTVDELWATGLRDDGTDLGHARLPVSTSIISTPTPKLTVEVEGNRKDIPDSGDVRFTISPAVQALTSSTDLIDGKLTVSLDPCVNEYSIPSGSVWEVESDDLSLRCGDPGANTVTLKLKEPWLPSKSFQNGATKLPSVSLNTVWSKLTEGSHDVSAVWDLTEIDGFQSEKLPDVEAVSDVDNVNGGVGGVVGQMITTSTPKVEINDPLKFRALVQAQVEGGTPSNSTVVVMPGRGDDAAYRALFDDSIFDGPADSTFQGDYVVTGVSISEKDSVLGATLQCTWDTNPLPSFDPSVNNWEECTGDISNITAIRINQPEGTHEGISVADIDLQPSGNKPGDNYLMWIGEVTGSSIVASPSLPANDVVVASNINGYVYWDLWEGQDRDENSEGIEGVTVRLLDSDGIEVASTVTDEDGFYEFRGYHSGDYYTEVPEIGDDGGVPETRPSAFYPDKEIPVEQTFSYKNQRLEDAKPKSSEINLGVDTTVPNVNFGYFAPDPYSDLLKEAAQINCDPTDAFTCDVSWDITVKNGGEGFKGEEILGAAGRYAARSNGTIVWTTEGLYTVTQIRGVTLRPEVSGEVLGALGWGGADGWGVWTKDAYYLVGQASVDEVQGIEGEILGAVGRAPLKASGRVAGSAVFTTDGYYVVSLDGQATKVSGIDGPVLGATGEGIVSEGYGSAAWTSDAYYLVDYEGNADKVEGVPGTILGATGAFPGYSIGGTGVWTTEGYFLVYGDKTVVQVNGVGSEIYGATGDSVATTNPYSGGVGSLVWGEDGYFLVDKYGAATPVTGLTGEPAGAVGSSPAKEGSGSGVWTSTGYFLVDADGVAKQVKGVAAVVDVIGASPLGSDGSAVWATDGYYLVNEEGVAQRIEGVGVDIEGITGPAPESSGSAVWSASAYYIVDTDGAITVADFDFPQVPEFTGTPITLTGGKLTDSTSSEVYSVALKQADGKLVAPTSETLKDGFVTREYKLPNLKPGEEVKYTFSGKVNRKSFESAPQGDGLVIANQAWETFTETERDAPTLPTLPAYDSSNPTKFGQLEGNDDCTATANWVMPGDGCGQVYAQFGPTNQELGALAGYVFWDQNRSGEKASTDPMVVGVKVTLYRGTNGSFETIVGETLTDIDGYYEFENLVPGDDYYVSFAPARNPNVSLPGGGAAEMLEPGQSWAYTTEYTESPFYKENMSAVNEDGFTRNVEVKANVTTEPVNAGLAVYRAAISTVKGSVDPSGQLEDEVTVELDGDNPGFTKPIPVTSISKNTGNESLDNLVFMDVNETGPKVEWKTCEISNPASSVTLPEGEGWVDDTYTYVFDVGVTLAVGETLTCSGTLAPISTEDLGGGLAPIHEDSVEVSGKATITAVSASSDSSFEVSSEGVELPKPTIRLEKGILAPVTEGTDCADEDNAKDPAKCAIESGTEADPTELELDRPVTITFRVTNEGEEPLLDPVLADQTTVGDDDVENISCQWPTTTVGDETREYLAATGEDSVALCAGELIVSEMDTDHQNKAEVFAIGQVSRELVRADSEFNGKTPLFDPPNATLPRTGGRSTMAAVIVAVFLGTVSFFTYRGRKSNPSGLAVEAGPDGAKA